MVCTLLIATPAHSQNFIKQLGNAAKNAAKNAVERNVTNKVEEGVDKAFDANSYKNNNEKTNTNNNKEQAANGWQCPQCGTKGNTGKFCNECGAKRPDGDDGQAIASTPSSKAAASVYQKCDFVPGDEIFFEDLFENEQVGDFPSRWDIDGGNAEIAELDGQKVMAITAPGTVVFPYMKQKSYLGDVFTIEFDIYGVDFKENNPNNYFANLFMNFSNSNANDMMGLRLNWSHGHAYNENETKVNASSEVWWTNGNSGEEFRTEAGQYLNLNEWNHIAISFNKRALKMYVNGQRIAVSPNAVAPEWFKFSNENDKTLNYIRNVRIAKGAVPMLNRLQTDGKIVTYAITFETGKADLKPESMVEIIRIAKLMNNDASLNFEVQGHCDNTGSDKVNDPLSQKRAEAIVDALIAQGVKSSRLTAVGKGSHNPIADNATEEGRAKNRRVEFIKK